MSLYKGTTLISGAIPDMANQSLSNLDSAGQDKFDAKVNKSGDTMTGDLTIRPDSSPHIYLQNSNFTKGTNPSSNIYWEYRAEDSNTNPAEWYTNRVGNFVTTAYTDGTVETAMFAYQNNQNANTAASIYTRITSAGVASCNFPNTTCCDGQWVRSYQAVISTETSVNGSSNLPYTISLPYDGYNYEVLFAAEGRTNNASGNYMIIKLCSDILPDGCTVTKTRTRTASTVDCGGSIILPVGTSHNIYVPRSTNWHGNITGLAVLGYRRIGTNS